MADRRKSSCSRQAQSEGRAVLSEVERRSSVREEAFGNTAAASDQDEANGTDRTHIARLAHGAEEERIKPMANKGAGTYNVKSVRQPGARVNRGASGPMSPGKGNPDPNSKGSGKSPGARINRGE